MTAVSESTGNVCVIISGAEALIAVRAKAAAEVLAEEHGKEIATAR